MEIPKEEFERGMAAILPFAHEWKLSLNPEDLEEIVYAVLLHARTTATLEAVDAAVRQQLAEYKWKTRRFQSQVYGGQSPEQAAVKVLIELLVEGDYETVERVTPRSRLHADALRQAVADYGRTLTSPGDSWWEVVELTPISADAGGGLHVAAPLWTEEEGRSDLTLELRLVGTTPSGYEVEIEDLHVL